MHLSGADLPRARYRYRLAALLSYSDRGVLLRARSGTAARGYSFATSARRWCSRARTSAGSYSRWARRLRATTTPVAATPARPATPMSFQGTRTGT
jgi:hypothetical protein